MSMLLKPNPDAVKQIFNVEIEPTQEFAEKMGLYVHIVKLELAGNKQIGLRPNTI